MNKFFILAGLVVLSAVISCNAIADQILISNRITSLEDAINNRDIPGFLACFDQNDYYVQTWGGPSEFNSAFPSGYSCSFGDIVVTGDTAICANSTSTLGIFTTSHYNEFDMIKIGSDWFISKWYIDHNTIPFVQNRQPAAQQ